MKEAVGAVLAKVENGIISLCLAAGDESAEVDLTPKQARTLAAHLGVLANQGERGRAPAAALQVDPPLTAAERAMLHECREVYSKATESGLVMVTVQIELTSPRITAQQAHVDRLETASLLEHLGASVRSSAEALAAEAREVEKGCGPS